MEASLNQAKKGWKAILTSEPLNDNSKGCFSFWYHMFGRVRILFCAFLLILFEKKTSFKPMVVVASSDARIVEYVHSDKRRQETDLGDFRRIELVAASSFININF